jgi:hypothetical protein
MKALGVLESKWDPIRKKLVRRLLEEQDKVQRSYFTQKGGMLRGARGGTEGNCKGREHVLGHVYVKRARADRGQVTESRSSVGTMEIGVFCLLFFLWIC